MAMKRKRTSYFCGAIFFFRIIYFFQNRKQPWLLYCPLRFKNCCHVTRCSVQDFMAYRDYGSGFTLVCATYQYEAVWYRRSTEKSTPAYQWTVIQYGEQRNCTSDQYCHVQIKAKTCHFLDLTKRKETSHRGFSWAQIDRSKMYNNERRKFRT